MFESMTLSDWFTLIALCVILAGASILAWRNLYGNTIFDELDEMEKDREAMDEAIRDMNDRARKGKFPR